MVEKANAGQAGTVSVATAEGLVRVSWHSVVVQSPAPFVLEDHTVSDFKKDMNSGEMPSITVLSKSGPSVMVDVTCTKGFFQVCIYIYIYIHTYIFI